ncbi:MAG: hypothetical protein M3R51_08490 [Candidatus Eremiobacteraeota bacterium]|nr:hypothetical protein [Candidatus Eremiobacteraeota bacterium]
MRNALVRRAAITATLVLLCSLATVQQIRAAGIDTITAYAGTWQSHVVHYKTAYSKARTETTHLRNDCWRSAGYFACDQFLEGASKALIVFTYDTAHNVYHTYAVPTDGTPASSGKLLIAGNTWTFPWKDTDKGRTVYGRVVNIFSAPNTIEYRQEYSYDKAHWTVTARGTEHRLSS